jgi:hypothetical protein
MSHVGVRRGNARDAELGRGVLVTHPAGDSRSGAELRSGRRRHYGVFYGVAPLPDGPAVAVVHGNCQAESLRLALDGPDLATVRIPPVHELAAADLPHLRRTLARASVLISQPVRDGYHDLPLGSDQLAAAVPPGATVLRVPVIRFAGLYPTQAIIRPPSDRSAVPPLVPYHDLATLARAAGHGDGPTLSVTKVQRVAAISLAELRRRELAHDTVAVADLFVAPDFAQMRTINHPGNSVWETLARRVRERLGLGDIVALTRPLLNAIHGPREREVIDAFGLDGPPQPCWTLDGEAVDPAVLRHAHLSWYRDHPDAVAEGLRRHAAVLAVLSAR